MYYEVSSIFCFFFNDTATTEIYTLSLHDALPIWPAGTTMPRHSRSVRCRILIWTSWSDFWQEIWMELVTGVQIWAMPDRKSTRLNSSHANISYAVFCLKKKRFDVTTLMTYIVSGT